MAGKNILTDLKNIRDNEVSVSSAINYLKEFVKRKFNEVISIHDHKLRADELVKDRDFTPRMLDKDSKILQYSIKGALVSVNVGGVANDIRIEAGEFYDHSFYAFDRKTIAAIKAVPATYDPSRYWIVSLTNITLANNNGHWLYLKVPTGEGVTTSELIVSEGHIDPLFYEGYIVYKLGYAQAVTGGIREVGMLWGNKKGGGGVAQIQSDWNQADNTKADFIKNKPTIPAAQVQSDWNATEGLGVILNKPTIANESVQALSGTTVAWNAVNGVHAAITLSGNTTITLSNLVAGKSGNLTVTNPATIYTLTFAGYTNKISPAIYSAANQVKTSGSSKIDCMSWYYDGTYLIWNGTQDYK